MTTPRLREELQRIGDRAPVASVPADTWSRARAARRRNLAGAVTAVAACAAVLAGLTVGLPGDDGEPPVADTHSFGVPDRIESVPSDRTHRDGGGRPTSEEVTDDLDVGTAAAAFLAGDAIAVVIDATEGRYHLLDLPGVTGDALALSPNGELLAYASTSGVRILDLTTGELRSDVDLAELYGAGQAPAVQHLDWSTRDDRLVWSGQLAGAGTVAGRVLVDDDGPVPGGELGDPEAIWAATELGGFGGIGIERGWFHDGATDWRRRVTAPGVPVALRAETPDLLALRRDGDTYRMYRHGAEEDLELALPATFPDDVSVVGWLPDARMVVSAGSRLLVVAYGDDPSLSQVGEETSGSDQLSIATDLMTEGQPTVHRAEPDWP